MRQTVIMITIEDDERGKESVMLVVASYASRGFR